MITQQEFEQLELKVEQTLKNLHLQEMQTNKGLIEEELQDPNIWSDQDKATKLNKELRRVEQTIEQAQQLSQGLEDMKVAMEMEEMQELNKSYSQVSEILETFERETYLNGKFDTQGAILSIHAGAGGLDAQDWASMLLAMYQSFAKNQQWQATLVNLSAGEEGGVKSATLEIIGERAYGYLKEEAGVHRLVRISPFNSGGTRETSFALVEVLPNDLESEYKLDTLDEKDLRWEYSTSSGKGGQSVNTTYSAVKLIHIPTNMSVSCQNERSQLQNKQQALKYLKNKLLVLELQKQQDLKQELKGGVISAQWGSQIRSYTLHPYKLVKDHRSGWETTDVDKILVEGNLMPVIWSNKYQEK